MTRGIRDDSGWRIIRIEIDDCRSHLTALTLSLTLPCSDGSDAETLVRIGSHEAGQRSLGRLWPSASNHLGEALLVDQAYAEEGHALRSVLGGFDRSLRLVRAVA